jgi:hypothetical protein
MGVAEAGIHHVAMSFDRETGKLFLIEGYDFGLALGTSVDGGDGHVVFSEIISH